MTWHQQYSYTSRRGIVRIFSVYNKNVCLDDIRAGKKETRFIQCETAMLQRIMTFSSILRNSSTASLGLVCSLAVARPISLNLPIFRALFVRFRVFAQCQQHMIDTIDIYDRYDEKGHLNFIRTKRVWNLASSGGIFY